MANPFEFLAAAANMGLPIGGALAQGSAAGFQRRREMDVQQHEEERADHEAALHDEEVQAHLQQLHQALGFARERQPLDMQALRQSTDVATPGEQAGFEQNQGLPPGASPNLPRATALRGLPSMQRTKLAELQAGSRARSEATKRDIAAILADSKRVEQELGRNDADRRAFIATLNSGVNDRADIQADLDRLDASDELLKTGGKGATDRLSGVADSQAKAFGVQPAPSPMVTGSNGAPASTATGDPEADAWLAQPGHALSDANKIRLKHGIPLKKPYDSAK